MLGCFVKRTVDKGAKSANGFGSYFRCALVWSMSRAGTQIGTAHQRTLVNPITPASDTGSLFSQHGASLADPQLPLIRTNVYPGLSSHLGINTHATPTWWSSEVSGCVHVLSYLFLHRGYQGFVIGPGLI
uniref:Uncharacterized protein n=1 Tax=Mesocestoides corti TaxID=53468 RepID=A0A5K3FTB0_MESCO